MLRSAKLDVDTKRLLHSGKLLGDEFVSSVVKNKIVESLSSGKKSFILDGFPRSVGQCHLLLDIFNSLDLSLDFVVKFQLSKKIIISRLAEREICGSCGVLFHSHLDECRSCGSRSKVRRSDDMSLQSIENRIDGYLKSEVPIIKFFRDNNVNVISIDASREPSSITSDIKNQFLLFS